ncbi:glycoside Hydrolase Family 73 [Parageobacillus genomosp. 1]|uniref:Glycoside Hydrolase Family 73 n=1 Tax=Parageobacillus genomosp. 1 TaxID=1295642 RepID=A0ABC9VG85_9BACL|nr:phage tail family protein [Parageobacillus genomosp. 1]EZP77631.1 glycoside Hydrolase Family 73 [Parageobacillus genomosp. 1]
MTYIQRKDGTLYDLQQLGIRTKDFVVSAPSLHHNTEEIENRDGVIDLGTTEGARTITCTFRMQAVDMQDYPLLQNEIFKLFRSKEAFYLIDRREPMKRWEVKCQDAYDIDQRYVYGDFTVTFVCFKGYAESVGTTLDPFTFDSELWQIGQGLTLEDDLVYTHNTSNFRIYNAGDVTVDPRVLPLKITFTGASTNLKITNTTTGDMWQYTGTTQAGDTITLDGVRSLKNSVSIFSATNRKLITIASGWNDFTITGASGSFTISFDFRFYYI